MAASSAGSLSARGNVPFTIATSAVVFAYAMLAFQQVRYGIEFDEGFNLTVVNNLASGLGYSTTGIVQWTWEIPFDPNASTGPALLLPASLLWWISGGTLWVVRIVPLLLFLLYALALWVVFRRLGDRWLALVAAASPLVMSVGREDLSTVSLVPGRFVGEFAAVALVGLMILLLTTRHPLAAGLAGGLAIQTKINFALPVVFVAATALVIAWAHHQPRLLGSTLRLLGGLVIPTVAFEIFRAISLGIQGYVPNVKAQISWLLAAVDSPSFSAHMLSAGRRLGALASTLSVGGSLLLLLAALLLVIVAFLVPRHDSAVGFGHTYTEGRLSSAAPVLMFMSAGVSVLLWWGFVPPEKLPRIGIPIILFIAPVILTGGLIALRLFRAMMQGRAALLGRILQWSLAITALLFVVTQGLTAVRNDFGARLMDEQRAASAAIQASGTPSLPMDWIWNLAEYQLLAGIPAETKPGVGEPTIQVFTSIRARTDAGVDDARALLPSCGDVLFASQNAVVCRPRGTS